MVVCSLCNQGTNQAAYWFRLEPGSDGAADEYSRHRLCPECMGAIYPPYLYSDLYETLPLAPDQGSQTVACR